MKVFVWLILVILTGCASNPHAEAIRGAAAACNNEVQAFEHDASDYRNRLKFDCK